MCFPHIYALSVVCDWQHERLVKSKQRLHRCQLEKSELVHLPLTSSSPSLCSAPGFQILRTPWLLWILPDDLSPIWLINFWANETSSHHLTRYFQGGRNGSCCLFLQRAHHVREVKTEGVNNENSRQHVIRSSTSYREVIMIYFGTTTKYLWKKRHDLEQKTIDKISMKN